MPHYKFVACEDELPIEFVDLMEYVNATVGNNITLNCTYLTSTPDWKVFALNRDDMKSCANVYGADELSTYPRHSFPSNVQVNILILSDISPRDHGNTYRCIHYNQTGTEIYCSTLATLNVILPGT